jgi:hypothetical protein
MVLLIATPAVSREPVDCSIIQLIASPDEFDGKYVQTIGFVRVEFEGFAIFLSSADAENDIYRNSLAIAGLKSTFDDEALALINGRYALIQGVFHKRKAGYRSLFSGSIDAVDRLEPWKSRGRHPPP